LEDGVRIASLRKAFSEKTSVGNLGRNSLTFFGQRGTSTFHGKIKLLFLCLTSGVLQTKIQVELMEDVMLLFGLAFQKCGSFAFRETTQAFTLSNSFLLGTAKR
jgi:hypothetical protein